MKEAFIISAKRTPIGSLQGSLSNFTASELGATSIKAVVEALDFPTNKIDHVYMGNVLSANLGQSPARQASLLAGLSYNTDCTAINKVCASGLKAVMIGAQQIQFGLANLIVAGGMESMSNTPHYLEFRSKHKLGDGNLSDGILKDGLTDFNSQMHMGKVAELCAKEYHISRSQQDEYALQSYTKAIKATDEGMFQNEIIPITDKNNLTSVLAEDEDIRKVIPEKIPILKPAFQVDGTITAANASNISDGAAALLLASPSAVTKYNFEPIAKITAYADAALHPLMYATAPAIAILKALQLANLSIHDIDFFEINEAYAAVIIANQKLLGLNMEKLNVYGGAIAMGHPLGASGARILCTLLSVLKQEGGKYGLAAICNGGGGASAMIIENM
ncbi:MAG: acetyl-CoA C-acyltransferase [Aquaticitalea sp.]